MILVEGRSGKLPEKSSTGANRLNPINIDFDETLKGYDYSQIEQFENRYNQFKFFVLDLNSEF